MKDETHAPHANVLQAHQNDGWRAPKLFRTFGKRDGGVAPQAQFRRRFGRLFWPNGQIHALQRAGLSDKRLRDQ